MRRLRSWVDLQASSIKKRRSKSQVKVGVEVINPYILPTPPPTPAIPTAKTSKPVQAVKDDIINIRAPLPCVIDQLPFELLGEIFVWHTHLEWFAPLFDGAVCRTWRAVVIGTPRVWAYLKSSSGPKGRIPRNIIKRWTSRVGAVPLHFRLEGASSTKAMEVFPMVAPNAKCLFFNGNITSLTQSKVFFPMLERMTLFVEGLEGSRRDWDVMFPHLRELHLHQIRIDWSKITMPPLQSLHIELSETSPGLAWYNILQQCARTLQYIALDIRETVYSPPSGKIELPRLRGLQINFGSEVSEVYSEWIANFMDMPSITSIHEISAHQRPALSWNCPTLEEYSTYNCVSHPQFHTKSFPSLKRLGVGGAPSVIKQQLDGFADSGYLPALEVFAYKVVIPSYQKGSSPVRIQIKVLSPWRPNILIQHMLDENCHIKPMFDECQKHHSCCEL